LGGKKKNDTKGKGRRGRQRVQKEGEKYDRERKCKTFSTEKFKREHVGVQKETHRDARERCEGYNREHARG